MFTRQHLIQWLVDNVTDRILQNALNGGKVESFGWFNSLPYINTPGFIVSVTSYRQSTYLIAVGFKEITGVPFWFRIEGLNNVTWSNWKGGTDKLHQGDFPEKYRRLKDDTRN